MKRYLHFETVLLFTTATLTLLLTVLRILALSDGGFDDATGYYVRPNGYATAASVLTWLSVAAALVLSVFSCFGKLVPCGDPKHARFSALLLGAVLSFFIAFNLSKGTGTTPAGICLRIGLYALIGGVAFCFLTFLQYTRTTAIRAVGAMCAVVFGIFYAMYYYFLATIPMNGPQKTLHILCAVAIFMFFLCEAQRALGLGRGIRERFFALVTVLLTVSEGLAEFASILLHVSHFENFTHPLLLVAVGAYAYVRLVVTRRIVPRPAKVEVTAAANLAGEDTEGEDSEAAEAEPVPED